MFATRTVPLYRPDLFRHHINSTLNIAPRVNGLQFPVVAAIGRYLPSIRNIQKGRKITAMLADISYQQVFEA